MISSTVHRNWQQKTGFLEEIRESHFNFSEWSVIRELEKKELPEDSINARWVRLNEIVKLAKDLGVKRIKEDKTEIYERWAKLKDKYESGLQSRK